MILYQLNKKQNVIGISSSDILNATFEEQINTAGNLKFTVAKKLRDDCLYVLFQRPSATTYMCFKILTETQEDNQVSYTAVESAYDELGAYSYIKDMRPQNRTAKEMLQQILAQTRYSVGYIADTGTQTTNFYYTTVLASLQSVVNLFNLEITFDVVFDPIDNQVKRRLVNLYQQQGARTGRRFEYGDKLLSVTCEQSSDELVTALVGRGSSVQVSEGTDGSPDGYSRKITFADVVWKKSAGNPLDKPAGQEYLEDPSATAVYGFSDGKPRIGFVEFDKIDDKNLLIKATYDKLQELKRPKVSFKASVTDVGNLSLGDTVAIIRHDLKIEYLTRVYKVTHDLLNAQNNTIELGDDFQKASITSTISAVQDTVQSAKEYSQSALQSANGKNTNFYGTNQPLFAVEGDLWYKDLGNGETEMYQYKNGNWELITSTAELHNVQKVVDQAKADMEQAKTDAQTAYDEAIKATGTANGAKAQTAEALEQAKQANDSYTALAKEVADNKTSADADYKRVSDDYTALAKEVAGNKASVDADYQKAQADITQAQKDLSSVTDTVTEVKKGQGELSTKIAGKVDNTVYQTYVKQTNQSLSEKLVASDLSGYAKTVDVTKSIDGVKTTIADNTGKITTMQTDINGVKSTVKSAQGDISALQTDAKGVKATVSDHTGKITQLTTDVNGVKTTVGNAQGDISTLQTDAKSIKATVSSNAGKIATMQTDVNGIKTNVKNAQGDISTLQTDAKSIKATVSSNTGKITQLTTDVSGIKASVSSKVDKTVYQSYVAQTDKALSAKLTASDLKGYAKTTDLETRAGKIEASLTSLQGDMSYKATTLVDKPEFSDGDVGGWVAGGKPAVLYKTGGVDGYHYSIQSQNIDNLYASAYWKPVASESKWYVEALIPNFEPAGGKNVYANASLYYIRPSDGKNAWSFVDCGAKAIAPQHWGWVKGYVTVPYGVTKVKPCISMKRADGTNIKSAVKYCQFTLVNAGVQNQLTTLSGKITATSDRLSSVYTKSETDAKLKTKVEQSALTQTSNNLSASIAKNSKILSSAGLVNENAYINANKIALNGKTLMSNATINDAFIGNMSANKITTGTIDASKINVINIDASKITTGVLTAVEMHQNGGGADTWINKDGIHNQMGNSNVWIKRGTLAAFDSSGQGMYMESGQLTLASSAYWQNGLKLESINYGVIKCDDDIFGRKGIGVIGKGGFNVRTDNCVLSYLNGPVFANFSGAGIIGDDAGRMMLGGNKAIFITAGRVYENISIAGINDRPYIQIGGQLSDPKNWDKDGSSVVINAWDIKLNACGKDNRNIILNRLTYNGEHTINLNDSTSDLWWGPKMHAPSFVNTSALSKKMNITKLDTQTAINAIKNTDIYDYQFKEFGETGKHYASLIIDDVNDKPQYRAAGAFVDGLGRDDGTQLGYLTVVVQNLLEEIDILKERIDK